MGDQNDSRYNEFLGRGGAESSRLNKQHELLKEAYAGLLHPIIQELVQPGSKIADLATGTGIFVTDLAQELFDSTILDGYDISNQQFPPKETLPHNVTLSVLDSLQPVPEALRNRYDIVCIRYLTLALRPGQDWHTVAANARSLLKVGGHIHWMEPNLWQAVQFVTANPDAYDCASWDLSEQFRYVRSIMEFPDSGMSAVMAEYFKMLSHQVVSTDRNPGQRDAWKQLILQSCETSLIQSNVSNRRQDELSESQIKALITRVEKQKVYARFDLHRFVGRKN